ncbi:MAG TPA: cation transporter [candidate division Zixibacteria bacterium]|nr:cation transporter [candidate division Zixibacteria bacterium]
MAYTHSHNHIRSGKRLFFTILLNIAITISEIIGGLMTGYLALLADAVHNLSDVAALVLAYIGDRGAARPPTKKATYGFKRLEVMTAFISAVSLVVIAIYIFYEAYRRFLDPQPISNPTLLLVIASIGLLGNVLSVWILHAAQKSSLNIKTAFLHMLYDTLSSAAVILGAVVIINTGWLYLDPILSVIIGLMILWSSFDVLKEATIIFFEGVPRGIKFDEVALAINGFPKIINVHHLHIWSLSSSEIALSCHICLAKADYHLAPETIRAIGDLMQHKFGIGHCTIQAEMDICSDDSILENPFGFEDNHE